MHKIHTTNLVQTRTPNVKEISHIPILGYIVVRVDVFLSKAQSHVCGHSKGKKADLTQPLLDPLADKGDQDDKDNSEDKQPDIPTLAGVNLSIPSGSLVMIIGKVGSGKTSLLASMINEISIEEGHVQLNGKAAYCSQLPWIQVRYYCLC